MGHGFTRVLSDSHGSEDVLYSHPLSPPILNILNIDVLFLAWHIVQLHISSQCVQHRCYLRVEW